MKNSSKKKKSFFVLGINEALCASAALLKDGEIIAAASEERFTRVKNEWGFPKNAIIFCCDFANIKLSEIDLVVLSYKDPFSHFTSGRAHIREDLWSPFFKKIGAFAPKLEYQFPPLTFMPNIGRSLYYRFFESKYQKRQDGEISQFLGIDQQKIVRMDHHLCHAYTAYFSSPNRSEKETVVLTCDGAGDQTCSAVFIVKNNTFRCIARTPHASSLGLLYSSVTHYLGLRAHEDEYKVMGLAPYAPEPEIKKAYDVFKNALWVDGFTFRSIVPSRHFDFYIKDHLQYIRFDHIAGAIQKFTEEILLEWCKNTIKETKIKNLACGGGIFLNVKANKLLTEQLPVENIFFMPSAGDDSNAIGAAYYGYQMKIKNEKFKMNNYVKPISNLYLGPQYSNKEILDELKKIPTFKVSKPKNIAKTVAQILAKGEIVARFTGRMEMGARALGNRSILADPKNYHAIEKINKMIKMRDFWMPFSPTILFEKQHDYIKNSKNISSPFMSVAFDTTQKGQRDLAAAIHPYDKTARAQIIRRDDNLEYYKIIVEFEKLTGTAAILNTSFNIHGEPIVCTPQDALATLIRSGLKYLAIENYLIIKQ